MSVCFGTENVVTTGAIVGSGVGGFVAGIAVTATIAVILSVGIRKG